MVFVFSLLIIMIGAFLDGTSAWPIKACKKFGYEHVLFLSMAFGLFLVPWTMTFCLCDIKQFLHLVGWKTIIISNLFSLSWGVANVLATVCLVKIGFVMVGVLLGGTALIVATLTPMIFKGSGVFANSPGLFSPEGFITIFCVIIMIIAISMISKAGELRDKQLGVKGVEGETLSQFQSNIYKLLTILAGVLSTGIVMINTYCADNILNAMKISGSNSPLNSIAVWAVGMFVGVILNMIYALCIMKKNNSFKAFVNFKEFIWCLVAGCQFLVYMCAFAWLTPSLGVLGATIGNGVTTCVQIGSQQFVGFIFGEWKGVNGKPIKVFTIGIILLVVGIIILSFNN